MTSCRSIGLTDSGVMRGFAYDPATAMIAAAVVGGGSQLIAADKASSAANKANSNQKAVIQRQVDAYDTMKATLERLKKGGAFDSSLQEAQAKRDAKLTNADELKSLTGDLIASGTGPGASVSRDAITSLEAKGQARLAQVLNAIRQNSVMNELSATSALNSGSASLNGAVNTYANEAGYYRNKADSLGDISGGVGQLIGALTQQKQNQNTGVKDYSALWSQPKQTSLYQPYGDSAKLFSAWGV